MFVGVDDGGGWATGGRITQIVSDNRGRVGGMMSISLSAVELDGEEDAECRAVNKQIKIPCLLSPPAYKNTKAPNSQQGGSLHPAFSARQYQYITLERQL